LHAYAHALVVEIHHEVLETHSLFANQVGYRNGYIVETVSQHDRAQTNQQAPQQQTNEHTVNRDDVDSCLRLPDEGSSRRPDALTLHLARVDAFHGSLNHQHRNACLL
jgi:hypothetical protein